MDGPLPPTAEIEDTLLILPEIEPSDQGTYRCLASNVLETVYAQITIIVQGKLWSSLYDSSTGNNSLQKSKYCANVDLPVDICGVI